MLNPDVVQAVFNEARRLERERSEFVNEADFYAIRDKLFQFVMSAPADDTVVAMSGGTAAQIVEYVERTEELIPAMAKLIYALAFGTAQPGWVPSSFSPPYPLTGVQHGKHSRPAPHPGVNPRNSDDQGTT